MPRRNPSNQEEVILNLPTIMIRKMTTKNNQILIEVANHSILKMTSKIRSTFQTNSMMIMMVLTSRDLKLQINSRKEMKINTMIKHRLGKVVVHPRTSRQLQSTDQRRSNSRMSQHHLNSMLVDPNQKKGKYEVSTSQKNTE